ncbi:hypothetical protein ACVXG9_17830 [Escherichia coli]
MPKISKNPLISGLRWVNKVTISSTALPLPNLAMPDSMAKEGASLGLPG